MTDFDGKKYVAVYDQFKVSWTNQNLMVFICAWFETPVSMPEHDDYDDEVIMAKEQICAKQLLCLKFKFRLVQQQMVTGWLLEGSTTPSPPLETQ